MRGRAEQLAAARPGRCPAGVGLRGGERAALHKAAAEWLEEKAQQAGRLEEFAGLLGDHAERAGETSAAAEWYTRAGERAKAQGAPREARAHFDRALELFTPDERERRWRALLGREEALDLLGEREAQRRDLEALLELAWQMEDNNRLAWAYYRQAIYTFGMGDYRMSVQAEGEALTAAQRAGNAVLEVLTLAHKALTQTRLLDMNAARATAEEALARAQTLGDEPTLARTLNHVALHYIDSGDIAKAAQLHTRHVEILHRLGHRDREAIGLSNLGFVYVLLGLYKLARAALKESLRLAEAIGYRGARAYALQNLGLAYFRSGDGRAARRVLERSLVDMTAIGDAYGRAESILYLAFTLEYSGDLSGAAQRFAEAKKIYCSTGSSGLATDALAGLGGRGLGQGQPDEAHQHVTDLWNYLNQHGTAGMEMPVWAYLTCADIFDALGEEEQSRAAIEAGYRELVARARQISHPEWRRAFLENVPAHRAIVELGERLVADGGQAARATPPLSPVTRLWRNVMMKELHIASANLITFLRRVPLFADLNDHALEMLARVSHTRRVPKGYVLFSKDDPGTAVYAVLSGSIAILLPTLDGRELVINEMGAGESFGELALLPGQPRSASAVAREASEVITIPCDEFLAELEAGAKGMG